MGKEEEGLLETLCSEAPDGFYSSDDTRPETRSRRMLPPPEERVPETPAERAIRLGQVGVRRGRSLLEKVIRSRR